MSLASRAELKLKFLTRQSTSCCFAGQEITQFTYFQQAGGQALEVPSVEITYGLERIISILQVNIKGYISVGP